MLQSRETTLQRLEHPRAGVRQVAVYLLASHWRDNDCVPLVCRMMLEDPDPNVREEAFECLRSLRSNSKDRQIAQTLASTVNDDRQPTNLRRAAYAALRDIMGLNVYRHGLPSALKFPEQVDWDLVVSCLRQEEFAIQDDRDLPFFEQAYRMIPPEIVTAMAEFDRADQAFHAGNYADSVAGFSAALALRVYPETFSYVLWVFISLAPFGATSDP